MKKLEGEEAISYLTRLQKTMETEVNPKKGRYHETWAQAGLLYNLVSLERTFLKISSEKRPTTKDTPTIMIEATGFPNVSMMLAHVKYLLGGLEIDERGKAVAMELWLNSIMSLDTAGMARSAEIIGRQVVSQEDVAKALGSLDMTKIRYLEQICRRPSDLLDIPLFVMPDHPGLLAASHETNPFDQRWERGKNSKQGDERIDLRKYIDANWNPDLSFGTAERPISLDSKGELPEHPRWPAIIRTQIDNRHSPIQHFGSVVTPEVEVYFKKVGDDSSTSHDYFQSDLTARRLTINKDGYRNYLVPTLLDLYFVGFDDAKVSQTVEMFQELYGSLSQVREAYDTLALSAQPSKESLEKMTSVNQRVERVVLTIDDPQIKAAVQVGIVEAIESIKNSYRAQKMAQKFSWRTVFGNLTNRT